MNGPSLHIVVFTMDDQRYALHLPVVERVVRAVEITQLPKAPEIVAGVIYVQGDIVPVIDMRKRLRLSPRELRLSDQMVIARTSRRTVALVVDAVSGVLEILDKQVFSSGKIAPWMEYVEGIVQLEDGLVLIQDLDQFLSLDEERALDASLSADD